MVVTPWRALRKCRLKFGADFDIVQFQVLAEALAANTVVETLECGCRPPLFTQCSNPAVVQAVRLTLISMTLRAPCWQTLCPRMRRCSR